MQEIRNSERNLKSFKMRRTLLILSFAVLDIMNCVQAQVVNSGTCGDNLKWTLTGNDNNLTLTINGTGTMKNYVNSAGGTSPWYSYKENITTLEISKGIETIGEWAFFNCKGFRAVRTVKIW